MKTGWIILGLVLVFGCINPQSDKISFKFPADIKNVCVQTRDQSKALIENKGTPLELSRFGCEVVKIPGMKKVGDLWYFKSKSYGSLVGGLYLGSKIEIGCNPATGGEVNALILTHEWAHYWLYSNFGDMTHNAKYAGSFIGWGNNSRVIPLVGGDVHVDFVLEE